MDRKELLELEKKCIQEEPPYCAARCPIHVDARAFMKQAGSGAWEEARKILDRVMPLSGILGRICDHPCEEACKRKEAGDPIAVGALERFCVETTGPQRKIQVLPSRGMRVALLGDDLDSLTACWDLLRKGYGVTLFCPHEAPGGPLRTLPGKILPVEAIERELAVLKDLGLLILLDVNITSDFCETACRNFDAVYAGSAAGTILELLSVVNPGTLETNRERLFSTSARGTRSSFIEDVAMGRKAAVSVDRFLQKTSMAAGREKEGAYATRLYTSLEEIAPLARVAIENPNHGYHAEEAIHEAKRCLQCQCMECVKACEYLERFKAYPKVYARDIYNSETAINRSRQANRLVNSCMLCGLCQEICPHDFSMADLCLQARRRMVRKEKMPPSAHEFAIRDMLFSNSEHFALARNEPGTSESAYLFFPGCQLSGSAPEHVERTYSHLRSNLQGGVGLMLGCCGAPAEWGGREDLFQGQVQSLLAQWKALGKPRIIAACATCQKMFHQAFPDKEILSLCEALELTGLPVVRVGKPILGTLAVHDPCTTRHQSRIQESVRRILSLMGYGVRELTYGGTLTECCGYGGLLSNADRDLASDIAKRRGREDPADYVAYCAMCRDSLAAAGKRVVHLLDLIWGPSRGGDPARRESPGYSERRENRARLKRKLLIEIWQERPEDMGDHEKIIVRIAPEVMERMENRRILVEDVLRVIEHAERTGRRLRNPETGHLLAHYTPAHATYWVEYSLSEEVFTIYNTYSHRMKIEEEGS